MRVLITNDEPQSLPLSDLQEGRTFTTKEHPLPGFLFIKIREIATATAVLLQTGQPYYFANQYKVYPVDAEVKVMKR